MPPLKPPWGVSRGVSINREEKKIFSFSLRKREPAGEPASDVLALKRVLTVGGCP